MEIRATFLSLLIDALHPIAVRVVHCSCTENVPRIGHSATMPRYTVRSLLFVNLLTLTVALTQHFTFNSSLISRIFAILLFNVNCYV